MATIAAGNSLYIYRLLADKIGFNRQTLLSRFEEVFSADEIDPFDLDCSNVREVLENLPDYIEIITFKKGNTYAIVKPYQKWDEVLKRLDAGVTDNGNSAKKSNGRPNNKNHQGANRNPWKSGQTKDPRPIKPGSKKKRIKQTESITPHKEKDIQAIPEVDTDTQVKPEHEELSQSADKEQELPQTNIEVSNDQNIDNETIYQGNNVLIDHNINPIESTKSNVDDIDKAKANPIIEVIPSDHTSIINDKLQGLPESFFEQVYVKGGPLLILNQILPVGIDIIGVLEQDWRAARGSGVFKGSRSEVTYPLRYLRADGSPIEITMRRMPVHSYGKKWAITQVDGDDGSTGLHEAIEVGGAPQQEIGAWHALLPASRRQKSLGLNTIRELSEFAVLGTWDSFIDSLASRVQPEKWSTPGKVGNNALLSEYIADTFHRVLSQDRLMVANDRSIAAFNTGLYSRSHDDIYACFSPHEGDIAWQFMGFTTARVGVSGTIDELGKQLIEKLDHLPRAATYIDDLSDISISDTTPVELSDDISGRMGDQMRIAFERTVNCVRNNWRLATPAYIPSDNKTVLLLPLSLDDDGRTDCAMVLEHIKGEQDRYCGICLAPLVNAYACARVVSSELPTWLNKGIRS